MTKTSADERRSARADVELNGALESGGACNEVRVVNLSAHGALVAGGGIPPENTQVTFRADGIAIDGWIAWVRDDHAGIEFDGTIEPAILLRKAPIPSRLIIEDPRRPGDRGPGIQRHSDG